MWCSRSIRVKPARLLAHAASQVCFCGRVYLHSCQCRIPGRTWVHLLELAELRSRVGQKAHLRRQWRPSLSAAGRTASALRSRPWLRWNGLLRALESRSFDAGANLHHGALTVAFQGSPRWWGAPRLPNAAAITSPSNITRCDTISIRSDIDLSPCCFVMSFQF
jgi:hypothetical protein